jgi:hypothetical protein
MENQNQNLDEKYYPKVIETLENTYKKVIVLEYYLESINGQVKKLHWVLIMIGVIIIFMLILVYRRMGQMRLY